MSVTLSQISLLNKISLTLKKFWEVTGNGKSENLRPSSEHKWFHTTQQWNLLIIPKELRQITDGRCNFEVKDCSAVLKAHKPELAFGLLSIRYSWEVMGTSAHRKP